jgi:hypothetical protein
MFEELVISDLELDYFKAYAIEDHEASIAFIVLNLSNIPSHPKTIKSHIFSSIVNYEISGTALTTPFFPPYFSTFASISPKVLETLSLPGKTLYGPKSIYLVVPVT